MAIPSSGVARGRLFAPALQPGLRGLLQSCEAVFLIRQFKHIRRVNLPRAFLAEVPRDRTDRGAQAAKFATQHVGYQRTGLCNCGSDGARRVKSRFGYSRRVWTVSSSMNCRAYGARERCGSQAVTFQRPIEAPRWTNGTAWTFPRGIRTLDGITATP